MPVFTDSELKAFLDGTLPEEKQAAVVKAMESDPDLEQRLMDLDQVAGVVQEAFETIAPGRSAETFLPETPPASRFSQTKTRPLMAACIGGLLLVGGYFALPSDASDIRPWMHQVAAYQALYSVDTISGVDFGSDDITQQLERSGTALDLNLRADTLFEINGLQLKRAQLLAFKGQPLSQIVFADAGGNPIALCVFQDGAEEDAALAYAELEGMESARFSVDGYSFILIGPTDGASIKSYATQIFDIFA